MFMSADQSGRNTMNSAPMKAPLMLVMPPTIEPTRKSKDFVIWNDSGLT